jgi:predicted transcriptional regulator
MAEDGRLTLIASIAASYLRRNSVGIDQIGAVVASVTHALDQASKDVVGTANGDGQPSSVSAPILVETKLTPAVPIKKSVQPEFIVCLEDGVHARTLKRHLQSAHGLTPQQYREKWKLPKDYPIVAPAYSEQRSKMAKALGLGHKAGTSKAAGTKGRPRKAR